MLSAIFSRYLNRELKYRASSVLFLLRCLYPGAIRVQETGIDSPVLSVSDITDEWFAKMRFPIILYSEGPDTAYPVVGIREYEIGVSRVVDIAASGKKLEVTIRMTDDAALSPSRKVFLTPHELWDEIRKIPGVDPDILIRRGLKAELRAWYGTLYPLLKALIPAYAQ